MERAVQAALVPAHHADRPETDPLVGANGALVGRGRVDGEPMVTACLEQVPRKRADRVGAEAAVLECRGEEDVDAGVAVLRLVLLPVLDAARDLALDLDHERRRVVELGLRSPPARDLGLAEDLEQPRLVRRGDRPEGHARAVEDVRHVANP